MSVTVADIKFFHSGGAGNTDPNASLGGVRSSTEVTDDVLENLFDDVSNAELVSGIVDYRCIYIYNDNDVDTWQAVRSFRQVPTPSADTIFAMGVDPAGPGDGTTTGVAQTIANEATAPTGVTFTSPSDYAGGIVIGDLAPNTGHAIWLRRTVSAGASSVAEDSLGLRAQGDTI